MCFAAGSSLIEHCANVKYHLSNYAHPEENTQMDGEEGRSEIAGKLICFFMLPNRIFGKSDMKLTLPLFYRHDEMVRKLR